MLNEIEEFDEWLSPNVMATLINAYAHKDPQYGHLKWEYAALSGRRWGSFRASGPILYVNKSKTKGLFKQQIETILHEIQHWNQFIDVTRPRHVVYDVGDEEAPDKKMTWREREKRVDVWKRKYSNETRVTGYFNNSFEMGARDFASEHLEEAMRLLAEKHYGAVGKIEDSNLEDAVDEIVQDYIDQNEEKPEGSEQPVTRLQIGKVLQVHGLNNAAAMKHVLSTLHDLGVKVK
jgi:hypothetical protein